MSPAPYLPDYLPLFFTFDFPECSNFIELTRINQTRIYVEECECQYLYFIRNLGSSYQMRSYIFNDRVPIRSTNLPLSNVSKSITRLVKYRERVNLNQADAFCSLNFLKAVCARCINREHIAKTIAIEWCKRLWRPTHPFFQKIMEKNYSFYISKRL